MTSVVHQVQDWAAGADADRLTIELLVSGLETLAEQPTRQSRRSTHGSMDGLTSR